MADRLYPLATLSPAVTVAAGMGLNVDALADIAGIPHGLLADPDALITARQYHELCAFARRAVDDPGFCLNIADLLRLDMVEVLGPLFATTPTLRSYIDNCVRFMPLISPCVDIRVNFDGDDVRCYIDIVPGQGIDDRYFHVETCLAGAYHLMRSVFKRSEIGPRRIEVQHDGSAWLDAWRKHFGNDVEIVFNAPENVAVFRSEFLDLANPGHSPTVHAHMQKLALARLAALPNVETISTTVLRLLEQTAGEQVLDLNDVAERLGMTTRTLQRRLGDDHTTFQKLRDGLRLRQAQTMLRDPALDMATIAATLGFSEPATFHRAFRAWSGLSPSEFRRRQTDG